MGIFGLKVSGGRAAHLFSPCLISKALVPPDKGLNHFLIFIKKEVDLMYAFYRT